MLKSAPKWAVCQMSRSKMHCGHVWTLARGYVLLMKSLRQTSQRAATRFTECGPQTRMDAQMALHTHCLVVAQVQSKIVRPRLRLLLFAAVPTAIQTSALMDTTAPTAKVQVDSWIGTTRCVLIRHMSQWTVSVESVRRGRSVNRARRHASVVLLGSMITTRLLPVIAWIARLVLLSEAITQLAHSTMCAWLARTAVLLRLTASVQAQVSGPAHARLVILGTDDALTRMESQWLASQIMRHVLTPGTAQVINGSSLSKVGAQTRMGMQLYLVSWISGCA